MSLEMTRDERETFLADLHVGVFSVSNGAKGPLSLPIWYAYEPGGELRIITDETSRKAKLLNAAGRFSLCAQTEDAPYKYVSVEGPITSTRPADFEGDLRPMAQRYLGTDLGNAYAEANTVKGQIVISMRPERWRTTDYSKEYGTPSGA
jgi:hypothetical protein